MAEEMEQSKRRLAKKLFRQCCKVENSFCRLKRWASTSTRRDKLASHFLALIPFASAIEMRLQAVCGVMTAGLLFLTQPLSKSAMPHTVFVSVLLRCWRKDGGRS